MFSRYILVFAQGLSLSVLAQYYEQIKHDSLGIHNIPIVALTLSVLLLLELVRFCSPLWAIAC